MAEFPEMKGFSTTNLKYMRRWYLFYCDYSAIGQQPVDQLVNTDKTSIIQKLTSIPWGHNIVIFVKSKTVEKALFYVENTQTHNWSRSVLTHHIENGLWEREGKAITNFNTTLPVPQSDLAQ